MRRGRRLTLQDGSEFPDFPATDIVRDSNGDLYVSNDFGVMRRGKWLDQTGQRGHWASDGRSGASDDRAQCACPIRGNPRAQRLEADTSVKLGVVVWAG